MNNDPEHIFLILGSIHLVFTIVCTLKGRTLNLMKARYARVIGQKWFIRKDEKNYTSTVIWNFATSLLIIFAGILLEFGVISIGALHH